MLIHHLASSFEDPALPNLLPEDYLFNELPDINDIPVPNISLDVSELKRKFEQLTIEVNTLNLRLEIERSKRQRLQTIVRQLKRDITAPCPELREIRNDLSKFIEQQNTTNYLLDGENAKTNTLAFRSISLICELIDAMTPGVSISPEALSEVKILLHELALTVQQFGVHYATPYV